MILVFGIEHFWYFFNKVQLSICIFRGIFWLLSSDKLFVDVLKQLGSKLWFYVSEDDSYKLKCLSMSWNLVCQFE
jgi:hypothetical protein